MQQHAVVETQCSVFGDHDRGIGQGAAQGCRHRRRDPHRQARRIGVIGEGRACQGSGADGARQVSEKTGSNLEGQIRQCRLLLRQGLFGGMLRRRKQPRSGHYGGGVGSPAKSGCLFRGIGEQGRSVQACRLANGLGISQSQQDRAPQDMG